MLTLHSTAEKTKVFLKFTLIGGMAFVLLLWLIQVGKQVKEALFPTPPPPPTVRFGKLPPLSFPVNEGTTKYTYTVDTLSGELPVFPHTVAVHEVTIVEPTLLSLKKATEDVAKKGFTLGGKQVTEWTYMWQDTMVPRRTLTMDILYRNFSLVSEQATILTSAQQNSIINDTDAIEIARSFVDSLASFPSEIQPEKATILYYTLQNSQLIKTEKVTEKKAIEVFFFQEPVNQIPIMYDNPPYSTMRFLIGGDKTLLSADYYHTGIKENNSTYPIKTATAALDELKKGKAFIAVVPNNTTSVAIKEIFLAYFIGRAKQQYLQPIIVFKGDAFYAYVPAVIEEWTEPTEQKEE